MCVLLFFGEFLLFQKNIFIPSIYREIVGCFKALCIMVHPGTQWFKNRISPCNTEAPYIVTTKRQPGCRIYKYILFRCFFSRQLFQHFLSSSSSLVSKRRIQCENIFNKNFLRISKRQQSPLKTSLKILILQVHMLM